MKRNRLSRRKFLRLSALSAVAVGARGFDSNPGAVSLIADPADPVASAPGVAWSLRELGGSIQRQGIAVRLFSRLDQAPSSDLCVVAAGSRSPVAASLLRAGANIAPSLPESLAIVPIADRGRLILLACAADARGLMYALLELADRVRHGDNPFQQLRLQKPIVEEAFNQIRSIGKLFVSDVEDKPWFNDRQMWPDYFAMLATQRINRFSLNFGIGFDTLQFVTDSYFLFLYPFLLDVPGYKVRAANLPDAERDRNLEMLRYISQQAVAHGIDFQIGIWTHGYQWADTPQSNYTIEGITGDNHAAYSRDALAALLKACPDISGVTLRTHGESGVREGSYDFWRTVFQGVPLSGRKLEIDLHPKGLDQKLIDAALATGMPVKLSPKYWAEHMGLPYHQTAIRELEMPHENASAGSFYSLSTGSRIFTRYGYADFLREDRPYTLIYRIWPGSHRFLLWGDPVSSAAHARAFRLCGSNGSELYEPLSFKGRRGSGLPGGRCAYIDASLNPAYDWEKYLYTYRVWGRLLYNPDADPETWRRYLRKQFATNASAVENALAAATRIIPLVTTAHLPSAANDTYHPENYTNQSIVDPSKPSPYGDTPAPKIFGNVSPLDPQLFARINDFAAELLKGERTGKYSPIEVAQWLEDLANAAAGQLAEAEKRPDKSPEFRRMAADVKIATGLGRFYAAKLRSAMLYAIHEQSGDGGALAQAVKKYREAREIWSGFAQDASRIYVSDITYGPRPNQRGHWTARLGGIDGDLVTMAGTAERIHSSVEDREQSPRVQPSIAEAVGRPQRHRVNCEHQPRSQFVPHQDLEIQITISKGAAPLSARLYYRHVNQAERYQTAELRAEGVNYRATIPASYLDALYSIQYYFELSQG
ncbi:MAG TPA: hypothetical protein VF493_11035, partial [Terriglobales bacterium]